MLTLQLPPIKEKNVATELVETRSQFYIHGNHKIEEHIEQSQIGKIYTTQILKKSLACSRETSSSVVYISTLGVCLDHGFY